MMRYVTYPIFAVAVLMVAGCARIGLPGEYRAEIRLVEGREGSPEPGYSPAEVQARAPQRTLTLYSGGRYAWRSGDLLSEGNWRTEGETLILRDDTHNGHRIQPALQTDRRWRIRRNGEIVNEDTYSRYDLEEIYTRTR